MRLTTTCSEAVRSAAAQRVSSVLVAVLCAAICVVTLLTVGRTATAEEQVLSRLDTAGSRLLVVSDDPDSGLITPAVIRVLSGLDTVERVVGVGAPFDVVNAVVGEGGQPVPAWVVSGELSDTVELNAGRWPRPGEALVAEGAMTPTGLAHGAGVVGRRGSWDGVERWARLGGDW